MNAGQGGVEVAGHNVAPLVPGRASLVIDADGTPHVGAWGAGLPAPGEQVMSVRQNQAPLVSRGVVSPSAGDPAAWGATVTSSKVVARSALGEDAMGNITYAGGMALLPADLAAALVSVGVVNAMQLDINPEWVQLDAAGAPRCTAGHPDPRPEPASRPVPARLDPRLRRRARQDLSGRQEARLNNGFPIRDASSAEGAAWARSCLLSQHVCGSCRPKVIGR